MSQKKYLYTFLKHLKNWFLIFYKSVQDYFGYKSIHHFIYPKHYDFCNDNVCHSLYYSTEYDDDYDDGYDFYEFAETIQNDGAEFCSRYNNLCRIS